MFCSKCAYELPAVAKFCVRCGARTQPSLASEQLLGSFCVNCGKPYDPSHKFCNYCGHLIPHPEIQSEPTALPENVAPPSATTEPKSQSEPIPLISTPTAVGHTQTASALYALFTVLYLAAALSFSCAIFAAAHAFGHNDLGDAATVVLIVSLLATSVLAVSAIRAWRRIVASAELKQRPRRVVIKAVVLALLLFTIFAVAGYTIGQNGAEAAQVTTDLAELQKVRDRVSKARSPNGSATIGWYIQMYKSIEPDVDRLEIILHRLVREYPIYRARFSQNDSSVSDSVSGFNVGIRRMDLLQKQIAVAKRIDGLDATAQMKIWHSEMIPLVDQEDALDKSK